MQASTISVARCKGTAFRGYARYLDTDLSPDVRRAVLGRVREETRRLFDPQELVITGMYPITLQHDFLEAFAAVFPEDAEERLRMMGRRVAEVDLRGVYRVFIKVTSVELTLKALVRVWNSYFDTGEARYEERTGGARVVISDPAHHRLHDPIAAGYIAYAVELAGGRDIRVDLHPRAGRDAVIDLAWR